MIFFPGILSPGFGKRTPADEAPNKAAFFGGMPDVALGAVPLSRAEQDALYLGGKSWETDPLDTVAARLTGAFRRFTH